jgi:hypothetical protein
MKISKMVIRKGVESLQWLETSWPISSMVLLKIDCTKGMQPPQPVPALVQDLTCAMVEQVPFLTLSTTSPLVTLWQEQI